MRVKNFLFDIETGVRTFDNECDLSEFVARDDAEYDFAVRDLKSQRYYWHWLKDGTVRMLEPA